MDSAEKTKRRETYRVMIVDDEAMAREDLRFMLAEHADVEVCWEAAGLEEAERILAQNRPDALFLDIKLRRGAGFDLVPHIDQATQVVFLTAFEQYAVRAFEINALDYLTKPVSPKRLAQSLDRIRGRLKTPLSGASAPEYALRKDDQLLVKTSDGQRFITLAHISSITSQGGNYAQILLKSGVAHTARTTLSTWEERLPYKPFLRVHRTAIVNIDRIVQFGRRINGAFFLRVEGSEQPLAVSRSKTAVIKELIASYGE